MSFTPPPESFYICHHCQGQIAHEADGVMLEEDIAEAYYPARPEVASFLVHAECMTYEMAIA